MRAHEGFLAQLARWIVKRKQRTTVSLEEHFLAEVRRLVAKGGYRSLSACLNEALRVFLNQERHRRIDAEMEKASRDEMFLADMQRTMEEFKYADAETARTIEKG
jgi:Arc/MetJ-type ribon-helix-helix transcriptional regulator